MSQSQVVNFLYIILYIDNFLCSNKIFLHFSYQNFASSPPKSPNCFQPSNAAYTWVTFRYRIDIKFDMNSEESVSCWGCFQSSEQNCLEKDLAIILCHRDGPNFADLFRSADLPPILLLSRGIDPIRLSRLVTSEDISILD